MYHIRVRYVRKIDKYVIKDTIICKIDHFVISRFKKLTTLNGHFIRKKQIWANQQFRYLYLYSERSFIFIHAIKDVLFAKRFFFLFFLIAIHTLSGLKYNTIESIAEYAGKKSLNLIIWLWTKNVQSLYNYNIFCGWSQM